MATLYSVAGCKYYIGAAMELPDVDVVEADFASVVWTEVKNYMEAGALGDAAALITTPLIDRGRDVKQKGTRNAPSRQDNFAVAINDPGQIALLAAEKTNYNYPFRVDLNDTPVVKTAIATVTIAAPGVFTWTAHGLAANTPVRFSTTGALPTGIVAGTTYYVSATGIAANTFSVSATPGGATITTSGTQSGVHTATTVPVPSKRYFVGLVTGATEAFGGPNNVRQLQCTVEVNTNTVRVAPLG
jgi:hypothetical protein